MIEVTRLPSGLLVMTDKMESVETVSMGVWVDAGTRHEQPEINGVSHLLEHMAFKGTRRRTARGIAEEIEAVGGHLNAYTSREQTAYYAKTLRDDLPLAVDIIADILQNSTLDPAELQREQAVVVQEINQAIDTPDDIIFDHFQATAYPGQALGRPVLGSEDLVRGMSRATVFDYMNGNYGADRMVLAAAGRLEHDRLVEMAAEGFAGLAARDPTPKDTARYVGGDYREERDIEQVHLLIGFDGTSYADPDFYAASMLSTLLGGGMSSRLFQEVRENRGLVYSIYSFTSSYDDGGLFADYAGTGPAEVAEVVPVVCDEIVKVADSVNAAEMQRARAQIKAGLLMSLESTSSRAEQLARNWMAYRRVIPLEEIVANIEAVDEAHVARVARRIFATRPTIAAIGPLDNVESYEAIASRLR
ncbi:MAG: insulinase family protein [Alphaproteobacteria bacterium]|nr:insulinase family protein [Alphaproteobacteria bacterium]